MNFSAVNLQGSGVHLYQIGTVKEQVPIKCRDKKNSWASTVQERQCCVYIITSDHKKNLAW